MGNIEKIEADIDALQRAKKIECIVKSLEAIQSDVLLLVEFHRILDSGHIDLIQTAHFAVGMRVVDIINRDHKNENENSAVSEYINLDIKLAVAKL